MRLMLRPRESFWIRDTTLSSRVTKDKSPIYRVLVSKPEDKNGHRSWRKNPFKGKIRTTLFVIGLAPAFADRQAQGEEERRPARDQEKFCM
jgi:hypothetical protein